MNKRAFLAFMHEKWLLVKSFITIKIDGLRLSTAIYMADALQKARNKRFYVIENGQGKLIWICNDDIKAMKRPRVVQKLINGKLVKWKVRMLPPKTTHLDVMRDCLYYTPTDRNNSDGMSVAERQKKTASWIKYMEDIRMNRIFGKLKAN